MIKFTKLLLILLTLVISATITNATVEMHDLKSPKPIFYRLGTTDSPETKVNYDVKPVIQPVVKKEDEKTVQTQSQNLTYADLSIKKMWIKRRRIFPFNIQILIKIQYVSAFAVYYSITIFSYIYGKSLKLFTDEQQGLRFF